MTQTYFPFDSGQGANVTESQWSLMAQNWLNTGVIKGALNELLTYADSTGMQVKVKSGQAWMKGHFYQSDAEVILAIAAANSSNPRIDRVIVRVDWTANTIQLSVLQGIPAASPTAPALTQNSSRWEISLAQVYVAANATTIASGNVTDERFYCGPDYQPNLPLLMLGITGNSISIPQSTQFVVNFNIQNAVNGGFTVAGSGLWNVPINGVYQVDAFAIIDSVDVNAGCTLYLKKYTSSGVLINTMFLTSKPANTGWTFITANTVLELTKGQQVAIAIEQDGTAAKNLVDARFNMVEIARRS
jgi:hypothetical protein